MVDVNVQSGTMHSSIAGIADRDIASHDYVSYDSQLSKYALDRENLRTFAPTMQVGAARFCLKQSLPWKDRVQKCDLQQNYTVSLRKRTPKEEIS